MCEHSHRVIPWPQKRAFYFQKEKFKPGEKFPGEKFNSFQSVLQHFFLVCGQEDFSPLKNRQAPLCKMPLGFEIASRPVVPSDGAVKLSGPREATDAVIQLDKEASCYFLSHGDSWSLPSVQGSQTYRSQSPPGCAQELQRV